VSLNRSLDRSLDRSLERVAVADRTDVTNGTNEQNEDLWGSSTSNLIDYSTRGRAAR